MIRDVLDILTSPGYVTLLEGQPGAGKTSLALKACSKVKKCTYISYADPESSLKKKLRQIAPEFDEELEVINAMSGPVESVFSEILDSLTEGRLVVLDTLDAMLFGLKNDVSLRSFLQLLYGSVKGKSSSMIMIAEGTNAAAEQLRFISDAIIRLSFEKVLGQKARVLKILKDRDYAVENGTVYFTLSNGLQLFYPEDYSVKRQIKRLSYVKKGPAAEPANLVKLGGTVLVEIDEDVPSALVRQYMYFSALNDLLKGYRVNLLVPPDESAESIMDDLKVAGDLLSNVKVFHPDAEAVGYDPDEFIEQIKKNIFIENSVDYVDLLSEENFAVIKPNGFELFLRKILEINSKRASIVHAYGYENMVSTQLEKKYVKLHRKLAIVNGLLMGRSIRPFGKLKYIRMDPENGEMEFIEMK
mgnify:CR=1 FL=1